MDKQKKKEKNREPVEPLFYNDDVETAMDHFVGIQYNRALEVNICGEKNVINYRIKKMDYFSAHADQSELIDYLNLNEVKKPERICLVHGEEQQALHLREKLIVLGYRSINIPVSGEKFEF